MHKIQVVQLLYAVNIFIEKEELNLMYKSDCRWIYSKRYQIRIHFCKKMENIVKFNLNTRLRISLCGFKSHCHLKVFVYFSDSSTAIKSMYLKVIWRLRIFIFFIFKLNLILPRKVLYYQSTAILGFELYILSLYFYFLFQRTDINRKQQWHQEDSITLSNIKYGFCKNCIIYSIL